MSRHVSTRRLVDERRCRCVQVELERSAVACLDEQCKNDGWVLRLAGVMVDDQTKVWSSGVEVVITSSTRASVETRSGKVSGDTLRVSRRETC